VQIKIFATKEADPVELNKFLQEDGKTIVVERIHTAAGGSGHEYGTNHYVTVEYRTLEQPPEI
jgi:hypothetical protein